MDRLGLPPLARWHGRQNADPLVYSRAKHRLEPDDFAPADRDFNPDPVPSRRDQGRERTGGL